MGQITLTAKVQLILTDIQQALLETTRGCYTDALNYVADYVYRTHILREEQLNKALYTEMRNRFKLKSQMTQSVFKKVLADYKTIQSQGQGWIKPAYKRKQLELVWDRDVAFYKGRLISVNTIAKRIKVPYIIKGNEHFFDDADCKLGTAKMLIKHGKYFLHVPVTFNIEETVSKKDEMVVGVDRGLRFIVTTYDSGGKCGFVSGRSVMQKRREYCRLRKRLQKTNTASSRKRLRKMGDKEHRWMSDVNHCISKKLVGAYPPGTLFVLENLTGINETAVANRKMRNALSSWAYYDLEQKISYKAKLKGSTVIKVDPAYTSQRCPMCGYTDRDNRDKKMHLFCCKRCSYRSNDDRIGAMNLCRLGIEQANALVPGTVAGEI